MVYLVVSHCCVVVTLFKHIACEVEQRVLNGFGEAQIKVIVELVPTSHVAEEEIKEVKRVTQAGIRNEPVRVPLNSLV